MAIITNSRNDLPDRRLLVSPQSEKRRVSVFRFVGYLYCWMHLTIFVCCKHVLLNYYHISLFIYIMFTLTNSFVTHSFNHLLPHNHSSQIHLLTVDLGGRADWGSPETCPPEAVRGSKTGVGLHRYYTIRHCMHCQSQHHLLPHFLQCILCYAVMCMVLWYFKSSFI